MDPREALQSLDDIHRLARRGAVFRGFRALPTAAAAPIALITAWIQMRYLPDPLSTPRRFAALWCAAAFLAFGQAGIALLHRQRVTQASWSRAKAAFEPFLASLLTASVITAVIVGRRPDAIPLLPGLWQIFYGLAILSSLNVLPRAAALVGAAFMGTGAMLLASPPSTALSPWAMALPFAAGHLAAAVVLYWNLERSRDVV